MRILLIEDNASIAELVQRSLAISESNSQDFALDYSSCGLDGLRLAWANGYDGYLIDLDLPDIPGLQVGLALRRLMHRSRIKSGWIAAVTAHSDATSKQRARELGFNAFLCKPFNVSDLNALLQHLQEAVVQADR